MLEFSFMEKKFEDKFQIVNWKFFKIIEDRRSILKTVVPLEPRQVP